MHMGTMIAVSLNWTVTFDGSIGRVSNNVGKVCMSVGTICEDLK